ncbi:MAG: hypothetical protein HKL91_00735 [Candidatus Eremiobacteraeota bacterium]|nr:hypothetical protein [Candidatus Eremiobacteraeota bacterium]
MLTNGTGLTEKTLGVALGSSPTIGAIAQGADSNFYFTDIVGNKIGQYLSNGGGLSEYSIPTAASSPLALAIGPDQRIYFSESAGNKIGQLSYF